MGLVNISLTFLDLLCDFCIEDAYYFCSSLLIACKAEECCKILGKHNHIVTFNIQHDLKPFNKLITVIGKSDGGIHQVRPYKRGCSGKYRFQDFFRRIVDGDSSHLPTGKLIIRIFIKQVTHPARNILIEVLKRLFVLMLNVLHNMAIALIGKVYSACLGIYRQQIAQPSFQ